MLIRCSSLHLIMSNAKSIDDSLLTDDVRKIQDKTSAKRTDEEKLILETLKNKTLSETAKSHIKDLVKFEKLGFREYVDNKYTKKGIECEDDAIQLLGEYHDTFYIKHSGRVSNDFITGECDILTSEVIRDIKCPWSIGTFPLFNGDAEKAVEDAGYDWQGRGYMWLYDRPKFCVDYVLMPTPGHLIPFDDPEMMIDAVENTHINDRIRTVTIERDLAIEGLIKQKVLAAQIYAKSLINQLS